MAAAARKQSCRTTSVKIGPPDPYSFAKWGFKLRPILSGAQYSAPPSEYIMKPTYDLFTAILSRTTVVLCAIERTVLRRNE